MKQRINNDNGHYIEPQIANQEYSESMYNQWKQQENSYGLITADQYQQQPFKLHDIPGDDRLQSYQYYLEQQRQPNKDQQRYISTEDIDGAKPKRLTQVRGKKKANFFEDQQLNDYHHKQKYQLLDNNLKIEEQNGGIDSISQQSKQPYYGNTRSGAQAYQSQSVGQSQYGLLNNKSKTSLTREHQVPKYEEIGNFDRLYNKRIDWKPILIKERIDERQKLDSRLQQEDQFQYNNSNSLMQSQMQRQNSSQGTASLRSTLGKTGAQMMNNDNSINLGGLRVGNNRKNDSQVNNCISLGQSAPMKSELSSNSYGKYMHIKPKVPF
eukprot:403331056